MTSNPCNQVLWLRRLMAEHMVRSMAYQPRDWSLWAGVYTCCLVRQTKWKISTHTQHCGLWESLLVIGFLCLAFAHTSSQPYTIWLTVISVWITHDRVLVFYSAEVQELLKHSKAIELSLGYNSIQINRLMLLSPQQSIQYSPCWPHICKGDKNVKIQHWNAEWSIYDWNQQLLHRMLQLQNPHMMPYWNHKSATAGSYTQYSYVTILNIQWTYSSSVQVWPSATSAASVRREHFDMQRYRSCTQFSLTAIIDSSVINCNITITRSAQLILNENENKKKFFKHHEIPETNCHCHCQCHCVTTMPQSRDKQK